MKTKTLKTIYSLLLVLLLTSPAAAIFKDGIHGMPWGSAISDHDHLTKVRQEGPIAYCVNTNMLYQVANQAVQGVVYGFFQDKLFSAYIKFQSPAQFQNMVQYFTEKIGEPKVTFTASDQQSIYRWKKGNIKIKLKMKTSGQEKKMAIYYQPLSAKANQVRREHPPEEAFTPPPGARHQKLPSAPLLDHIRIMIQAANKSFRQIGGALKLMPGLQWASRTLLFVPTGVHPDWKGAEKHTGVAEIWSDWRFSLPAV